MSPEVTFILTQLLMTFMIVPATIGRDEGLQLDLLVLSLVQIRLNFVQFCKELGLFSSDLGRPELFLFIWERWSLEIIFLGTVSLFLLKF